jgi:hypothetical protein
MRTLDLNRMGLDPTEQTGMQEHNGGFLPIAVVYACWAVMLGCNIIAAGMKEALNEYNKEKK